MELCRCEEYALAVANFEGHTIGSLKPFYERRGVPDGFRIKWVNNKANHDDMKLDKPVLLSTAPPEEDETLLCGSESQNGAIEQKTEPEPELEPKWIPFHNEISLRLCNENKAIKCPFT
ncbi:unnamed protein product [Callosobruchus maculatus]|uniref:Uncharacterized protein n=1 Tax=Callosobruchus maculatus TaxID=64391 RepID=A0A653BJJ8_CALMS|nr:unnamed protein product [Callosobruchus maculatus]